MYITFPDSHYIFEDINNILEKAKKLSIVKLNFNTKISNLVEKDIKIKLTSSIENFELKVSQNMSKNTFIDLSKNNNLIRILVTNIHFDNISWNFKFNILYFQYIFSYKNTCETNIWNNNIQNRQIPCTFVFNKYPSLTKNMLNICKSYNNKIYIINNSEQNVTYKDLLLHAQNIQERNKKIHLMKECEKYGISW